MGLCGESWEAVTLALFSDRKEGTFKNTWVILREMKKPIKQGLKIKIIDFRQVLLIRATSVSFRDPI